MLSIRNAHVYAPNPLGLRDVFVAGGRIASIDERGTPHHKDAQVLDAEGKFLVPGLIDQHVHITGAGGKHGYHSMTPELHATDLLAVGTTTVVGLLGTDGATRSIETLYAKAKALNMEGMSAYMHTGYYGMDPVHITGSAKTDLMFIDLVLGCKVAIADIRSSYPTDLELVRLLRDVRVGGMLAGKKGVVHVHLGALKGGMEPLFRMVSDYHFPIEHISPTHVGRTKDLFEQAVAFAKMGGSIDITTGASKFTEPEISAQLAVDSGVPDHLITFSTDGNAGLDRYDETGKQIGFRAAPISANLETFQAWVRKGNINPEQALKAVTSNPADNLGLRQKGRINPGCDADFCLFDDTWNLTDVIAHGKAVMKDGTMTLNPLFTRP